MTAYTFDPRLLARCDEYHNLNEKLRVRIRIDQLERAVISAAIDFAEDVTAQARVDIEYEELRNSYPRLFAAVDALLQACEK